MKIKGVVATGHPQTSAVAEQVLQEGGNAFDAVVAAYFMACVAEPVLASLGGGGFMMAKTASKKPFLLDFFVQTPLIKKPTAELDFEEILVDFGSATQQFHMGFGSIAVPGCVRGMFELHRQFCRMPIAELVAPAASKIKQGVSITKEQAKILALVNPIYVNRASAKELFVKSDSDEVLSENQIYQNSDLADVMETLAIEGEEFFYQGEIAQKIDQSANLNGGSITANDLSSYQTYFREPLQFSLNDSQVYLNPPPSAGGLLVNFACELFLSNFTQQLAHGSEAFYQLLADSIELTQQARLESIAMSPWRELEQDILFDYYKLALYQNEISTRQKANRGTTHISVADTHGNVAALTVSNGEGCGEILSGTGIMFNNMLGEDDLNPLGLNKWQPDRRLSSMMCPGITINNDHIVALGSGGSNRIRTAVLQVLLNKLLFNLSLEKSVCASRLHFDDQLYVEATDLSEGALDHLRQNYPDMNEFPEADFYFGGVNAVSIDLKNSEAVADPRRGGSAVVVS